MCDFSYALAEIGNDALLQRVSETTTNPMTGSYQGI